MAKKRKKQTLRQRRLANIRQNIRRMEKRGYEFPEGYYGNIKNLTTRQLGKITPQILYEESVHVDETGKFIQGSEFRQRTKPLKNKKLANIRQNIRRMEKRGYEFPEGYYEGIKKLSPEQIAKITPQTLYEEAGHIISSTGEFVPGIEFRTLERHWSALKGQATKRRRQDQTQSVNYPDVSDNYYPEYSDVAYSNIDSLMNVLGKDPEEQGANNYGEIVRRPPDTMKREEHAKNMLQRLLEQKKNEDPEGLAQRLADNYDDIQAAVETLSYSSDEALVDSAADIIAEFINGDRMTLAEKARYAEFSERNNNW